MLFYSFIFVVAVLDQITKYLVLKNFMLHESLEIIPGYFHLTFVRNTGAAFGILSGQPALWRQVFFVTVVLVALVALFIMYRKFGRESRLYCVGLGLIAGGAVGNLIDRVRFGSVVDFLDFFVGAYHWPAFNIADSAITVGVGLLLLHTLFFEKKHEEKIANNPI